MIEAPVKEGEVEAKPYTLPPDLEVPAEYKVIYKKAHDMLARPGGWIKWGFATHYNRKNKAWKGYCLMGAINEASGNAWDQTPAVHWLQQNVFGKNNPIHHFNDAPKRTKREVLSVLEELY